MITSFVVNFLLRRVRAEQRDQMRAQEALRESERSARSTIDGIAGLIAIMAPNGKVETVNRQVLEYFGRSLEELKNWETSDAVHPEYLPHVVKGFTEAIASESPYHYDQRLRRFDGEYRWFDNRGVPIRDDSGRIARWYILLTDIEDRTRALAQLEQIQSDFAHMTRLMTLGELTASIAHEVNQPLGAIVTSAAAGARWLATTPPQMDKARRVLERIANDGKRAAAVIQRIRALVKRQAPRKERLDINDTILEVTALAQYQLRRSEILLETRLGHDLPLVRGDRVQLQQVLLNLIINAIEAMSGIKERPRELTIVSASDGPDTITVEVRDSGTGLDLEHAPHLFEPFHTTKAEGIGIGLSISRSIVEAHGGRLSAAANAPHGTVFIFSLPINEPAP